MELIIGRGHQAQRLYQKQLMYCAWPASEADVRLARIVDGFGSSLSVQEEYRFIKRARGNEIGNIY
jgi:hypothetical protein